MRCHLCNDQPASISARLLSDDFRSIDWRDVCRSCLDNEGFCQSGQHYASREICGGLPMLHDPSSTWTSCGKEACGRLAVRQLADFAIREGLTVERVRSRIEQTYGPNGTMAFPQAAQLMENRLQELEAEAERDPADQFSLQEPVPYGPWDRRVTAVRPLPNQESNDYWEQLLFRALHSHASDRVRMTLTRLSVLGAETRSGSPVNHQRRVDALLAAADVTRRTDEPC